MVGSCTAGVAGVVDVDVFAESVLREDARRSCAAVNVLCVIGSG